MESQGAKCSQINTSMPALSRFGGKSCRTRAKKQKTAALGCTSPEAAQGSSIDPSQADTQEMADMPPANDQQDVGQQSDHKQLAMIPCMLNELSLKTYNMKRLHHVESGVARCLDLILVC